jgi:uncharacterized protein (DUF1330 family)
MTAIMGSSASQSLSGDGAVRKGVRHEGPRSDARPLLEGRPMPAPTPVPTAPGYAIAMLHDVRVTEELLDYMEAIEPTMEPFEGRWVSHGRTPELLEGARREDIVIIGFPDLDTARAWYRSRAYQELVPLRQRHSEATVVLLEGVDEDYTSRRTVESLRSAIID